MFLPPSLRLLPLCIHAAVSAQKRKGCPGLFHGSLIIGERTFYSTQIETETLCFMGCQCLMLVQRTAGLSPLKFGIGKAAL